MRPYFYNVYADGLVTAWLSRETAAFDRKLAASVGRKVPIMVVVHPKRPIWSRHRYH
jgi:hypothetical protein